MHDYLLRFLNGYFILILLIVLNLFLVSQFATAEDGSSKPLTGLNNSSDKRVLTAVRIEKRVKIDGRLNDSVWEKANFQSHFLQREPYEGRPATEKTEVGVLYDSGHIYLGVKCFDSEPDKIIAREMRRDAVVDDDDYFEFILDTYHDQRSGYYFITNPYGSKREAKLANEGQSYNPSWDGVWICKSQITEEGWFLEIAVPLKTLRFPEGKDTVWGINFSRMIRRKNEHVFWELIPRDMGHAGLFRLSEAGTLQGLTGIKMGGNLELIPYFLGEAENDRATDFKMNSLVDVGLDATIGVTSNMALDMTVNTDFAQVEADEEQVNLTRFSLYYPEKRGFFLEGAEVFSFGGSGRMMFRGGTPDMSLYYSRRLGLVDGHEARILGGAKMVGKMGRYHLGLMNIYTDEVVYEDDRGMETIVPSANFSIFRLSRDVFARGSIGMIVLNKQNIGDNYYNRSLGFDGHFPLTDTFTVSGYLAGTLSPDKKIDDQIVNMKEQNLAAKISLDYNSDLYQASASYQDIGARFNPEMGFNRRADFRLAEGSFGYNPRPKKNSKIRQFNYQINGAYRRDHNGVMLDNEAEFSFGITFQDSSRINLGLERSEEFVDYNWELREGYLVPIGTYKGYAYSIGLQSDKGRSVAGEIDLRTRDYYRGRNASLNLSSTITKIHPIRIELSYEHNYVDLPEGHFHTNTLGVRAFYFFSTSLYLKAYSQWNDDRLNFGGGERVINNVLLRWIYSPESNLYLVYNDGRLIGPGHAEIINRTFMIKATFFWRR